MPPVTLRAATDARAPQTRRAGSTLASVTRLTSHDTTAAANGQPVASRLMYTTIESRPARRGHLRLVSSQAAPTVEVHGRGGPDSCRCRECTMARHPAFGPKLSLV